MTEKYKIGEYVYMEFTTIKKPGRTDVPDTPFSGIYLIVANEGNYITVKEMELEIKIRKDKITVFEPKEIKIID